MITGWKGAYDADTARCWRNCTAAEPSDEVLSLIITVWLVESDPKQSTLAWRIITKSVYSSSRGPVSELRSVTCHIRSHSVTCHPTQVTPAKQARTRFTYHGETEGWADLADWLHAKIVYLSAVTHLSSDQWSLDRDQTGSRTHKCLNISPMPYRYATKPPSLIWLRAGCSKHRLELTMRLTRGISPVNSWHVVPRQNPRVKTCTSLEVNPGVKVNLWLVNPRVNLSMEQSALNHQPKVNHTYKNKRVQKVNHQFFS